MDFTAFTQSRAIRLLRATFDDWMEDNALRLSAALAYYSIFSIAPLLVIAVSIAGLWLGEEAVRGQVQDQLRGYVGAATAQAIESLVQSAAKPAESVAGAIVGFATMLLGASGVCAQLKDALNTIWEVRPSATLGLGGFLRERLLSFGLVLAIGFLLLTSLLLSTALAAVGGWFQSSAGLFLGQMLAALVSLSVVTLLFALIFKLLPDVEIHWREVWLGALATAVLFEAGKFALSWYLGRAGTASSFGAAGSVVLVLLWVYYASLILLFGAEFTQVYARESGRRIVPRAGAEPATEEQRAQEGLPATGEIEPASAPIPLASGSRPAPATSDLRGWLVASAACLALGAIVGSSLSGRRDR